MNTYEWIKTFFGELTTRAFLFLVRNDTAYSGTWNKPIGYFTDEYHLAIKQKEQNIAVKSCAYNTASQ